MTEFNRNKSIKEILREVGESSTSHGIPSIIRNENVFIKLLWLICLLGSMGYCAYGLYKSFTEFLNYEVVTQMSMQRNSSLEFPTITFCNKNPFNYRKNNMLTNQAKLGLLELKKNSFDLNESRFSKINRIKSFTTYNAYIFEESSDYLSFSINDTLLSCSFDNMPCNWTNFEKTYSPKFGSCYKFNSGKNFYGEKVDKKLIHFPGRKNALELELFVGYPDPDVDLIRSTGIQLFVQNSSNILLTNIEGISLSAGYETDIILKKTIINKLSQPYSNCIEDVNNPNAFNSKEFNQTVYLFEEYKQKYCLLLCVQSYFIKKCGCYDVDLLEIKESQACNPLLSTECIWNEYDKLLSENHPAKCFDFCPAECNSIEYDLKLSHSDFPSPFYADLIINDESKNPNEIRNFTTREQIKQSVVALNIFFDDLSYRLIKETPAKVIEDFVADVGGFLGLFIGVSFLSFVEIIELLLKIIIFYIQINNKK